MAEQVLSVTEAEIKDLTNVIKEQARVPKDAQSNFCEIWPQARTALELLRTFIGTIPGVSLFAKASISIVIAAGDAASSGLC